MRELRQIVFVVLLVGAFGLSSCGSHFSSRKLQSISITPTTANNQAQFVATGYYSDGSKVTPLPALWFTIMPWYNELNEIQFFNLDEHGKSACNGNQGTFNVVAIAPVDPRFPLAQMTPTTPQVSGMARLVCP